MPLGKGFLRSIRSIRSIRIFQSLMPDKRDARLQRQLPPGLASTTGNTDATDLNGLNEEDENQRR
jgi:hypothetical protein